MAAIVTDIIGFTSPQEVERLCAGGTAIVQSTRSDHCTVAVRLGHDPDDLDPLTCFVCGVPFKADDICVADITEGSAHAACFEGLAIVNLEAGEPSEGPIETWRYGDRA